MSQAIGNTALAYARVWHHVDASERVLGKLADKIALVLMGKHKPIYDPGVDCGDYVLVSNAKHVVVTGNKQEQKMFYSHSMYAGGLKETPYKDMMVRHPDHVIRHAVSGMLPKNRLRDKRLARLRVFSGPHMGIQGANVFRSWEDGSLPEDFDPSQITTSETLKEVMRKEHERRQTQVPLRRSRPRPLGGWDGRI
ncbi:ribosomal protein L13 domain-containing protein [Flagelloscypha sp. PMI_526]|nr:ribosomal protein L13 domain-containing protein [Flagelloscypha sp. PMI_526]